MGHKGRQIKLDITVFSKRKSRQVGRKVLPALGAAWGVGLTNNPFRF